MLKLEFDDEAFAKYKEDNALSADMTLDQLHTLYKDDSKQSISEYFPGEKYTKPWSPDHLVIAFAPQPTNKPY